MPMLKISGSSSPGEQFREEEILTRINAASKHNFHEIVNPSLVVVASGCMPTINHIEFCADLISNATRDA